MTETEVEETNVIEADAEDVAQETKLVKPPISNIEDVDEVKEPDVEKQNPNKVKVSHENLKRTEMEKRKIAEMINNNSSRETAQKIDNFFVNNADEIGNVCAAIPFLSVMIIVLATMIPSYASGIRLLVILIAAFVGIVAIVLLYKTSKDTADRLDKEKESEEKTEKEKIEVRDTSLYIISKWSIQTLKAVGVPEDLTGYLEYLLSKEEAVRERGGKFAVNPEVKAEGISNPDEWIKKLYQRFGETRVDEHIEPILKYTRRENPKKELSAKQPVEAAAGVS